MDEVQYAYAEWLMQNYIYRDETGFSRDTFAYWQLIAALLITPFKYKLPMDANRAADGLYLRKRYCSYSGISYEKFQEYLIDECSLLEMVAALAVRMEHEYLRKSTYGDRTPIWFWAIISNIGVAVPDDKFDEAEYFKQISKLYSLDVSGATSYFFSPIIKDKEIWVQAQYFITLHM